LINELGLETKLAEAEIQFVTCCEGIGAEDFTRRVEAADIGVTSVDYALADTGTLVLRAGHGRARSISLLPAVHIAVLKPGQIISGLDDLFPLLAETCERSSGSLDSALTFITGPSRTADIELTLVVGVHGPQELHVILLDEETCAKEGKQCVTFDSSRA
jgi:L-lactate dehydrogenase complex protein LldG